MYLFSHVEYKLSVLMGVEKDVKVLFNSSDEIPPSFEIRFTP